MTAHRTAPRAGVIFVAMALGLAGPVRASVGETPPAAANAFHNSCPIPAADLDYRFVVLADSRGQRSSTPLNREALSSVFAAIADLEPEPSFVFFVGDLSFGRTRREALLGEFSAWSDTVALHYPPSRVYPVFGGHERIRPAANAGQAWSGFEEYFDPVAQRREVGGQPGMSCSYYQKKFNPPRDRTDYSHTVYYCDFAQDRFFVLNNDCIPPGHSVTGDGPDEMGCVGHELGCGQLNWLRQHLVGNQRRHNFFFHHEPAFGTGAHTARRYDDPGCPPVLPHVMDSKPAPRNDFVRLLGYHGGTVLFSGHEHHYSWRSISHQLAHNRKYNPERTKNSLVLLLKASPLGQPQGPASAYSYEGAVAAGDPALAPTLRLWWTSESGPPDWHGAVEAGVDDAEQFRKRQGEVYLESGDLELMRDRDRGEQRFVGLRFRNVGLPSGQPIRRAEIRFTATTDSQDGPRVLIQGESTAFAAPFSQCRSDLQRRRRTRRLVEWQIGAWRRNQQYDTPDLSGIVQDLIDFQRLGRRFPGAVVEVKAGSSGAPWYERSCRRFMQRVQGQLIRLSDYEGQGMPYHFAVVDVGGEEACIRVRSWDGTEFPVP